MTRTRDLLITSEMLYLLSYSSMFPERLNIILENSAVVNEKIMHFFSPTIFLLNPQRAGGVFCTTFRLDTDPSLWYHNSNLTFFLYLQKG